MKFTLDFKPLQLDEQIVKKMKLDELLNKEMLNTRDRIIKDTVAGRTADGGALKEYSKSYKDAIDSGKIAGKAPGNHTVNLTATGVLMRSFKVIAESASSVAAGVRMFFDGRHPVARGVSASGARRKRNAAIKSGAIKGEVQTGKLRKSGGVRKSSVTGARKSKGAGARDTSNAAIAQSQYDMGRTGWMQFSKVDVERINKAVLTRIDQIKAQLFKAR